MDNKQIDKSETTIEQLTVAATLTLEALLKVLEKKGLVNSSEVIKEISLLKSTGKKVYS